MIKPEDRTPVVEHTGETKSNEIRQRLDQAEPRSLRTYTPSLAVLAESAGSYHWTPEGRQLADFSSAGTGGTAGAVGQLYSEYQILKHARWRRTFM